MGVGCFSLLYPSVRAMREPKGWDVSNETDSALFSLLLTAPIRRIYKAT